MHSGRACLLKLREVVPDRSGNRWAWCLVSDGNAHGERVPRNYWIITAADGSRCMMSEEEMERLYTKVKP
jgi:hypothetical protein